MNREKLKLILVIAGSIIGAWFLFYLLLLPKLVASDFVVNSIKNIVNQQTGLSLTLEKPVLETSILPEIELKIPQLQLKNGNKTLVDLKDFELELGFGKIFKHEIRLDELSAKYLFIDGNNVLEIIPPQENPQPMPETDWKVDIANAEMELENGLIKYNNSKVLLSSLINGQNVEITAKSNNFLVADIFDLVNTNLLIPDGKAMLAPLVKPSGAVSMDIRLNNNGISGKVNMKNAKACLKDLTNMPLVMPKGTITITPDQLAFSNFEGYYGKNSSNKIKIDGTIKDYYKTFDSNLTIDTIATNEFFSDYLAGLLGGTAIIINKNIPTRLIYKAINNEMNITWLTKIAKGVSFGVDDSPSPLDAYDRAIKGDFSLIGNKLDIKNINYYIAQDIHKGMGKIDPILVFDGQMDIATGELFNAGFRFGREMPSEFLNVFIGQKLFKGGTIKGDLHVAFENSIPKLDAEMEIAKTRIPSQRLYIKDATLSTTRNDIKLSARGGFKRIRYDIAGVLKNELLTPIIVRDLDMNLDKVDVERLMSSLNNQQPQTDVVPVAYTAPEESENSTDYDADMEKDDDFMFDTNLIVIEDCTFRLKEGKYKNLNFGNIEANMTLDKNGIFNLQSNKFDIAEGISTLKVNCDLKTLKYYLRLGVKEVDADTFSTALLNLSKEISGKASGLIELNSDASMKLNGSIKFLVNNGTIGKIGLVEYLMKVASIFRNPVVMISPTTIMDLVNIPEGKFDRIYGELTMKDNVIERMNIESSSPTLSALIRGRYDLEKQDASLRIYTRFSNSHKGIAGFFRNFSLNALANKVKLHGRNDANYYASELADLPAIDAKEEDTQVFLTQVEGDVEHNNFLSSLKKIK